MKNIIKGLVVRYGCRTSEDVKNALKEVIQEITLLGLWRAKFFEHAALYGGTALRILHGLDRFSEDLDFILLKKNPSIQLEKYLKSLETELSSFGLSVRVKEKQKSTQSAIRSAHLTANVREYIVEVEAMGDLVETLQMEEKVKVKLEIDTRSCKAMETETRAMLHPIAFFVKALDLPSLFSGKLHAILCRDWNGRVKGRDWFDLIWFCQKNTPVNYPFFEAKMRQSGHYNDQKPLDATILYRLLVERIETLDVASAKQDVARFIADRKWIEAWSKELFLSIAGRIRDY